MKNRQELEEKSGYANILPGCLLYNRFLNNSMMISGGTTGRTFFGKKSIIKVQLYVILRKEDKMDETHSQKSFNFFAGDSVATNVQLQALDKFINSVYFTLT